MCVWEVLRGRLRNLPQLASTAVLPVPGRKLSITVGSKTNRTQGGGETGWVGQRGADKEYLWRFRFAMEWVKHGEVRSVKVVGRTVAQGATR